MNGATRSAGSPPGAGPGRQDGNGARCCGAERDLRCGCGSLLARIVPGAVELKCRRCKRMWRVPLHS
jgi:hypothetical protein